MQFVPFMAIQSCRRRSFIRGDPSGLNSRARRGGSSRDACVDTEPGCGDVVGLIVQGRVRSKMNVLSVSSAPTFGVANRCTHRE
jgi:hypothetical protein